MESSASSLFAAGGSGSGVDCCDTCGLENGDESTRAAATTMRVSGEMPENGVDCSPVLVVSDDLTDNFNCTGRLLRNLRGCRACCRRCSTRCACFLSFSALSLAIRARFAAATHHQHVHLSKGYAMVSAAAPGDEASRDAAEGG